jgi:hypothetical protein
MNIRRVDASAPDMPNARDRRGNQKAGGKIVDGWILQSECSHPLSFSISIGMLAIS